MRLRANVDALTSRLPSTCWTRSGSASAVAAVPAGRTDDGDAGGLGGREERPHGVVDGHR